MLSLVQGVIPTVAAIPVWDQYVDLVEHSLDFLAKTFNSAGLAVIVFTIIVKTVILPLTVKATRSSKAMQELQPKIKELQKKHGKDRQKLSQETMRLYSQYQINPMAGCLPMLIQIPIFFGLYRAIVNLSEGKVDFASEYWLHSFLWLSSLGDHDPYRILPILAGVFQFVQTKMMRPQGQGKITDPQQAMMNTMMNFMPLLVIVFGWSFPSGPVIYWAAQSVYSVFQQWIITGWGSLKDWVPGLPDLPEHRRLGYQPPRDLDEMVVVTGDGELPKKTGTMGWLQKRMEEAQAQQTARNGEKSEGATTATSTATVVRAAKGPRPVKKDSPLAKSRAQRSPDADAAPSTEADIESGATAGARPRAIPRKSRPGRPSAES